MSSSSPARAKDWSATQYLKFDMERTRACRDLLARVPLTSPGRVVDLGCGPGNSTAVLAERFPDAALQGVDSSPDMIDKAKKALPGVPFTIGDVAAPDVGGDDGQVDLFFSNAVLHWLPNVRRIPVFRGYVERLAPGGVFAFQVPDNLSEPCHVAMRETAFAEGAPWKETLTKEGPVRDEFPSQVELYDGLKPLCADVDIWKTTYYHIMENHEGIAEWLKGSGLRPFLDPLSETEREAFLADYLARIRRAYPAQQDGKVLLAYPRLFVVATKA